MTMAQLSASISTEKTALPSFPKARRSRQSSSHSIGRTVSGLGLHCAQDTGFRTLGVESLLTNISFNPVVAWQVLPTFSVGAEITVNYGAVNLRSDLVWPTQHKDQFRFEGDDWESVTILVSSGACTKRSPSVLLSEAATASIWRDMVGKDHYELQARTSKMTL
jgi:Outer membrane protein transport protein (OMPP1/FadL/TodX).